MKFFSTLQRTLSLHFLLVAILPTLAFGLIAVSLLHKHLQNGIYQRNQILTNDIGLYVDQFLMEVELDLESVVRVVADGGILRQNAVDNYLTAIVQRSERFESLSLLDRHRQIRSLGLNAQLESRMEDYRGIDLSHHELFKQHAVIDRPAWSDTFISLVTGEPSVTVAIPVGDGILLGNIRLQSLSRQLSRFAMDRHDSCAIVDHDGTLIASSDPDLPMQRINLSNHHSITRTLHGSAETVLEQHDDLRMLESTARINRTGWVAWVGVDLDAKMVAVEHVRNLLAGFMLLAIILAACVALLDARRLMKPLSVFSDRAKQIAAGNYDIAMPLSGFVEIDQLAAGLRGMSHAVREREQSLISSEQRFRDLVNSIDGVVWEIDVRTGGLLFVSERSTTLLGYPPSTWLNDPDFWARHVHPEDHEQVVIRGRRNQDFDGKHDLEYRFIAADGRVLWIRDLVSVIVEVDETTRLLGVMLDVTERKQAEDELAHYRVHLEELVAQRTLALQKAQDELVQKERLAVLGQLTATVSHEIRNPLGTVANALFLMRETLGPDCLSRAERPMALAERSVQRCDGIISELLDFTRRRELRCEPVQVDSLVAEVLEEMSWPSEVQRRWHLDSGVTVHADSERLRRALINVVANALQAMKAGENEQELEIWTRRLADRCEIVIRDTGGGIPEEIRERIFEPMFSTKPFGVGLGVPIIHNIMDDHGGGVDFQSEPGKGTTVTLWLPLANSDIPADTPATEA